MILLPVSEAYALDYLAILHVKREHGLAVEPELAAVEEWLKKQLGRQWLAVCESALWQDLVFANRLVFKAIDRAGRDEISASHVQEFNRGRYRAKVALQRAFWPDQPVSEAKTACEK